jgi:hypothetical protein
MELLHLHHRNISLPENPLLLYMEIIKHRSSAKDGKMPCGKNIRKYALF